MPKVKTAIASGVFLWIVFIFYAVISDRDSKIIWIGIVGAVLGLLGIGYSSRRGRKENLEG